MRIPDNLDIFDSEDDLFQPHQAAEESKNDSLNEAAFYVEEPQLERIDLSDRDSDGDQENDMFNNVKRLMTDQHYASGSNCSGGIGNESFRRANNERNQVSVSEIEAAEIAAVEQQ